MAIFSHNDQWWFVSVREMENCVSVASVCAQPKNPPHLNSLQGVLMGQLRWRSVLSLGKHGTEDLDETCIITQNFKFQLEGKKKKLQPANFAPFLSPSFFLMLHKNTQPFLPVFKQEHTFLSSQRAGFLELVPFSFSYFYPPCSFLYPWSFIKTLNSSL